ncbi:MAG TPA: hypothetical protein DEV97_11295 [Lachnospiraceae bacterium]|nr:hypothetical protein [Lachnospiraceae bacterium]
MSNKVSIDGMADAVMKALTEYSEAATTDVKKAVRKAGNLVRKEISQGAPSDRGKYAKSWSTKTSGETATSVEVTVYSRMPGLPHLLEYGHAKRGGGRTAARPHIAPAEQAGEKQLMSDIERALRK